MDFIKHKNAWYWGKSTIIVANNGYGVVTVQFQDNEDYANLIGLSVHESARKNGLGNELLIEAEKETLLNDKKILRLYCEPKSWMFEWYKRHGYKKVGMINYCGPMAEMEKKL
jgi:ribosomal protein S18 acetylase RimI-like enzyme